MVLNKGYFLVLNHQFCFLMLLWGRHRFYLNAQFLSLLSTSHKLVLILLNWAKPWRMLYLVYNQNYSLYHLVNNCNIMVRKIIPVPPKSTEVSSWLKLIHTLLVDEADKECDARPALFSGSGLGSGLTRATLTNSVALHLGLLCNNI